MMKAISFDVWNTLIIPNPVFAAHRKQLIASTLGVDEESASKAYTKVKRQVDTKAEIYGIGFNTPAVYRTLLSELQVQLDESDLFDLIHKVNELFLVYSPKVPLQVIKAVNFAQENGFLIGIGSNSNFISGKIMHPFLEKTLGVKFDFGVYSDLCGTAKPNPEFFKNILKQANTINVTHIGDHEVCDGGAEAVGFKFELIKNPETLFNVVKEIYHG
jgi:putative hydrolase of the HAD superfamily